MNKKVIMISQPMFNKTEEEIQEQRNKIIRYLIDLDYEVIDSYFQSFETDNNIKNKRIKYLSKAIAKMSECDGVYFCKGWENYKGCIIEHMVAEYYGLFIIEEK